MSTKRFFQLIGVVTIVNVLSRFLGFVREAVIGYQFGTSSLADSVILAYTIPNFVYSVLGGAVATAYISVYSKMDRDIHKQRFHDVIFTYLLLFCVGLTGLFMILSKQVVQLFFNGLHPSEVAMTSKLFFMMAPATLFLVFSMWFSGILNVRGQFYSASFATLANNAFFIFIAVLLYPAIGVYAYGWGATVSAAIMVAVLVYYMYKSGVLCFRLRFHVSEKEYVLRMLKIAMPVLLGGATLQFYFFTQRMFASQLDDGYVAALNYASKLVQLPQMILMTAATTVIYPLLAKKTAEQDYEGISQIFFKGLRLLIMFIVPVSVFVYVYAEPIVKIIFEYGSFTAQSTSMTAEMLKIFVIGMFAHAANLFVTRFFYAMEKSFAPVATGIVAVFGVNIALISFFIDQYGAASIAWGTTISALFQFFSLLVLGTRQLKLRMDTGALWGKLLLSLLIVTAVVWLSRLWIHTGYDLLDLCLAGCLFAVTAYALFRTAGLLSQG
ncbi:murein biosynthesis integral membrane protein MurJ [Anoxybacillus sp. UARK-01]|uniref:murein biosynthesis integral membrane protein MurJ n=1 Tax=Anoxybacillaceae TaxID=3120669 RepID=UPI0009BB8678|nr:MULTISPECIES: murein biosynthesis integral membrane protein MurJ [Anoxybacillus]MBB3908571.1 putative peptidoglycan lipid II flippase [Anoxybacillus rupiensis]OQM46918.1 murein biosynthesis integral membrane protein MurJ [Anoxybacillus sp. UARK-01]